MNVIEAIERRRSCREFSRTCPSTTATFGCLQEIGEMTPSAGAIRTRSYSGPSATNVPKCPLAEAAGRQAWIATASAGHRDPCRLRQDRGQIPRSRPAVRPARSRPRRSEHLPDATELGLGSCCVGAFRESAVLKSLGLEKSGLTPVYMVVVGRKKE